MQTGSGARDGGLADAIDAPAPLAYISVCRARCPAVIHCPADAKADRLFVVRNLRRALWKNMLA
jgi:hypothetical protein